MFCTYDVLHGWAHRTESICVVLLGQYIYSILYALLCVESVQCILHAMCYIQSTIGSESLRVISGYLECLVYNADAHNLGIYP
jgi:hypothetical protein